MRKILLMLGLLLFMGAGHSFAQGGDKKESFNWQKQYLDEAGISADVQARIDTIKSTAEIKLKEIRIDESITDEVKKEKMQEIYKKRYEEINVLLTKEQREKIKEIKERLKKESEGS